MAEDDVILLVEDDADRALLMRRAFKAAGCVNPIHVVGDGEEVLAYLEGTGRFANAAEFPLPALVLLDVKMPGKGAFEVLSYIRSHPTLCPLRVVVLCGSMEMRDINEAFGGGANSFLIKPNDFEQLVNLAKCITNYWLFLAQAPVVRRGKAGPGRIEG